MRKEVKKQIKKYKKYRTLIPMSDSEIQKYTVQEDNKIILNESHEESEAIPEDISMKTLENNSYSDDINDVEQQIKKIKKRAKAVRLSKVLLALLVLIGVSISYYVLDLPDVPIESPLGMFLIALGASIWAVYDFWLSNKLFEKKSYIKCPICGHTKILTIDMIQFSNYIYCDNCGKSMKISENK